MDYEKLDDAALIKRIAQSDTEALGILYDRYGRLVFSIAVRMIGNRQTAEEITMDVFNRVWRKADSYRADKAQVNTWLSSMTRYRTIDIIRREGVRLDKESLRWAEVSTEPTTQRHNPETAVSHTLQKEKVRAALAQLPPEQREALALSYYGGYSHSQIAKELEQPLGTVKTRIRLAMEKLRHLLQDAQI